MSDLIKIDGGTAGDPKYTCVAGTPAALSVAGSFVTYAWELVWSPEPAFGGPAPTFSAPTGATTNLTPTTGYGGFSWLVKLTVDAGLETEDTDYAVLGVPHATLGWIIPPPGVNKVISGKADGWMNFDHGLGKILADVMAAGLSGGGGETVLFELDYSDLSQFETSPAPTFEFGTIVNAALTLSADGVTVGSDTCANGVAGWLFNQTVNVLSIKRIEMQFSYPSGFPPAMSGEGTKVGFIYACDNDLSFAVVDTYTFYDDAGTMKGLRTVALVDYSTPGAPVITVLSNDDVISIGYVLRNNSINFELQRDGGGDLLGFYETQNSVWVSPPSSIQGMPHGVMVGFIPAFLTPPAGMGASAMNRIGLCFSGDFTPGPGGAGPSSFTVSKFKIYG